MTQDVYAADSTRSTLPIDLFTRSIEDVYAILGSNPEGLSSKDVVQKQEQFGKNIIVEKHIKPPIIRFFLTLTDIFSILLFFASALAFLGQSPELAIAILVIIFINAAFTLYQEWQAEQEMRSLRTWIPDQAKVIRDNNLQKIDVKEIVPGDIIILE